MLEVNVVMEESFEEETNIFIPSKSVRVRLEHSLVSLSKWESFWNEPFLGNKPKTDEQTVSYIRMMILGDEPPPEVFHKLLHENLEQVKNYVSASMTATKVYEGPTGSSSREIITSELIYYWMVSLKIPVEFENWHLNRLLTLVRVINAKNAPKKKMSMADRRRLNQQRRSRFNTRG